jgi:hypothetical protein
MSSSKAMNWFLVFVFAIGISCEIQSVCDAQGRGRGVRGEGPNQDDRRGRRGNGQRGKRQADDGTSLIKGEFAPDFTLKSLDGKSVTKLAEFRGKKPVVLFFGSYT